MTGRSRGDPGALQAHPERGIVIWDGDCGLCAFIQRHVSRLDWLGRMEWHPVQSGIGRRYGIADEVALRRIQLVTRRGRVLEGFRAVRRMLYSLPAVWTGAAILLAVLPGWWRVAASGCGLLMMTPLVNPLGDALYDFVARNRYRLFPGSTCGIRNPTCADQTELPPRS